MKISVSNIAWKKDETQDALQVLKEFGIDAIDIAPPLVLENPASASVEEIQGVSNFYEQHGFRLVGMQSLLFGGPTGSLFESEAVRDDMLRHLDRVFRIGGLLGSGKAVFGSPSSRVHKLDPETAEAVAIEFFRSMSDLADRYGCVVCFEANPESYGCGFVTDTLSALEFIKKVNHPAFRLNMDTGTMIMNEEPLAETIAAAAPLAGHMHLSAPMLGEVEGLSHEAVAPLLRGVKYDGYLTLEMKSAEQGNLDRLRRNVEAFSRYYGG